MPFSGQKLLWIGCRQQTKKACLERSKTTIFIGFYSTGLKGQFYQKLVVKSIGLGCHFWSRSRPTGIRVITEKTST